MTNIVKSAFLDTSAIDFCYRESISGHKLKKILEKNEFFPVVGVHTTYELAKCFRGNKVKAKGLFVLLEELAPIFSCRREELYKMEKEKLSKDTSVDYIAKPYFLEMLKNQIDDYRNGNFDENHQKFIDERQLILEKCQKIWQPCRPKEEYERFDNFNEFLKGFLDDFRINEKRIEWVKRLLLMIQISLGNNCFLKFSSNLTAYPALRTYIFQHLYLDFKTEKNNATPTEDRFTDGIQVIEASYCVAFISHDRDLLNKQLKETNPEMMPVNIKDLK